MRVFGYILIVLNLLLSGGFVYLAVQDYSGRQNITAVGTRNSILLYGIPLDDEGKAPDPFPASVAAGSDGYHDFTSTEIPFVVDGPGGVKTTTISPALLYAYFAQAGNDPSGLGGTAPVASQMAEVKRVYGILKSQQDPVRIQIIKDALLRMAENNNERSDYRQWELDGNAAELTHAMDLKFHRVFPKLVESGPINPDMWSALDAKIKQLETQRDAAKKAAEDADLAGQAAEAERQRAVQGRLTNQIERRRASPPKDEADRKFRLATLLTHLGTDSNWQKRVAMIVGMKQYVKAIDGQAGHFKEISDSVLKASVADQDRFISQYTQLRSLAIQRTQLVLEMAEVRAQLTIQAQKDQDLVNQRMGQLTDLNGQLAVLRNSVATLLAKQTQTERALFLIEREIAVKLESIYLMEDELRKAEIKRYDEKK